jgi:hypothetical protein
MAAGFKTVGFIAVERESYAKTSHRKLFGAVYWTSPISNLGIHGAADDRVAQAILGETFPETGVYWVPGVSLSSENPEQF